MYLRPPTLGDRSMKHVGAIGCFALVCGAAVVGQWSVNADSREGDGGGVAGGTPDVIVGALTGVPGNPNLVKRWGTVGGVTAYSIGTTSCNIGSEILKWCDVNNPGLPCTKTEHPVISQNLYRIKNGTIEQVGMSWLKHGFCALAETLCSACTSDPWGCDALGIGCSDPYSTDLNGMQSSLGPLSQVNASTGIFPYPFTAPAAPPTIGRRLQVNNNDVDPALNAGALYVMQGFYVHPEDALFNTDNNNASYRRVTVGTFQSGGWNLNYSGTTSQQKPGIQAWKDHGLGVGVPDPDVTLVNVDVPNDGRFIVGYKVSQNKNGTWHYEYAIQNMTSDRSARAWSIPLAGCAEITNLGFKDIHHHSGEPYEGTDWGTSVDGAITWQTVDGNGDPVSFAQNANANALRWATMYNFRFDSDQPPVAMDASLSLFKPGQEGDPASVSVAILGPAAVAPTPDVNASGFVDGDDLGLLLAAWGTDECAFDFDGNGVVDGADLGALLSAWFE
jgi:hypothetical protein